MSHVKNIAILGGSGNAGSQMVKYLLESGKFNVTAITRSESSATFPSEVKVQKGDLTSHDFLVSALKGQDVFIITLAGTTKEDTQHRLIEAAAAANVPWVLPNEYGSDTDHPIMKEVPILASKQQYLDKIESLGKSSWIGLVTGLWADYGLTMGLTGVNIKDRTATLFDDGNNKLTTSTLPQVGRATAKLLELPVSELEKFKNKLIYVSSFTVSQLDVLKAVQKATGTTDSDWKISHQPVDEHIDQGKAKLAKGDFYGMYDWLRGANFKPGGGGDVSHKLDNGKLGLQEENLQDVVDQVVKEVQAKA